MRTAIALALTVLTACGDAIPTPEPTTVVPAPVTTVAPDHPLSALEAARSRWAAADLTTYRYEFTDDCGECDPTHRTRRRIVVWDGEAMVGGISPPSVDAVHDMIESAIEAGADVDVDYDELGVPRDVWIDREARAYDGGVHLLLTNVESGLPGASTDPDELDDALARWTATRPPAYEFRVDVVCGCEFETGLRVRVEGDRVTDWSIVHQADDSVDVGPATIDTLFDDLMDIVRAGGRLVESGAAVAATAAYEPDLGYPVWIGLDIEVLDDESLLADFPDRLIFEIGEFRAVESEPDPVTDLLQAQQRWSRTGLTDYRYRLSVHDIETAGFVTYEVTVRDGLVDEVTLDGMPTETVDVPAWSIDDLLFSRIGAWRRMGVEVDPVFHSITGHPVYLRADLDSGMLIISLEEPEPLDG